jgi:hypothetical protein
VNQFSNSAIDAALRKLKAANSRNKRTATKRLAQ